VNPPVRVAHVITGLLVGGAEMALSRLVEALPGEEFSTLVISLLAEGPLARSLRDAGAQIVSLGLRRGIPSPGAIFQLRRALLEFRPSLVQGWMYHGNLAGWLGARFLPSGTPLAWNIRQSLYDIRRERSGTGFIIRAGARLSRRPDAIVYNSTTARRQHEAIGYWGAKAVVIPNGFDLQRFQPSPEGRTALRHELGLADSDLLVGLVGRYHPMKGHAVFLGAARRLLDRGVRATFLCAGRDVTMANGAIRRMVERSDLADRVRLLGERDDMPRLFAGLDVACVASSWGEGLPNVIGEAMASGVPCVGTDIGDTRELIGSTGRIVQPDDVEALAQGIAELLREGPDGRRRLGEAARARIAAAYSLAGCTSRYAALYRGLADPLARSSAA